MTPTTPASLAELASAAAILAAYFAPAAPKLCGNRLHDVRVVGRRPNGKCRACASASDKRYYLTVKAARKAARASRATVAA